MQSGGVVKQRLLFHGAAFLVGNSGEGSVPLVVKRARRLWLANVHSRHSADHGLLGQLFEFPFHDTRPFLQRKGKSSLRLQICDLVRLANEPE